MVRLRFFEFNEFDARICNGEGLLGGPPTGSKAPTLSVEFEEALELLRSFGGGIGSGEDMAER